MVQSLSALATVTISVMGMLQVNVGANVSFNESGTLSRTGSFTDPSASSWTASVNYGDGSGVQPLTLNSNMTFALSHPYPTFGAYTVSVSVQNNLGVIGAGTFTVNALDVAPVLASMLAVNVMAGTTYQGSGSFTDPGADTWTATVNYGDGSGLQTLTLNPNKTFSLSHFYANGGSDTITVVVFDNGGLSGTGTQSVTVMPRPAPIANTDSYTTQQGQVLQVSAANGVLLNDTQQQNDPLTAQITTQPTNGSVTLNSDGSFTYTPAPGFNGLDSFTYQAVDGQTLSAPATVNITVNSIPQVNAGGNTSLNEGSTLSRTGSFTDPSGSSWTATVNYGDGSGVQPLTLNSNMTFALSHTYMTFGMYTVLVSISDNLGATGSGSFTVNALDVAPVVTIAPSDGYCHGGLDLSGRRLVHRSGRRHLDRHGRLRGWLGRATTHPESQQDVCSQPCLCQLGQRHHQRRGHRQWPPVRHGYTVRFCRLASGSARHQYQPGGWRRRLAAVEPGRGIVRSEHAGRIRDRSELGARPRQLWLDRAICWIHPHSIH